MKLHLYIWLFLLLLPGLAGAEIINSTIGTTVPFPFFYYIEGPFIQPVGKALDWELFKAGRLDAYDGKPVELYGYMFSTQLKGELKHFLFGPYAPNCAFHYHVKPELMVEVSMAEGIAYQASPLHLKGVLHHDANGTRLEAATLLHPSP